MQDHSIKLQTSNASRQERLKTQSFDIGRFFTSLSSRTLFVLVVIACMLFGGLGIWVGYMRFRSAVPGSESTIGTAVGAILGFFGFILGFAFSLTWSRFGSRNTLVITQAKAIGVCYLRTSLLRRNKN